MNFRFRGYAKYARLGDLVLDTDADDAQPITLEIVEHFRHPSYKPPSKYNDIALMRLERPVEFGSYVRPACLTDQRTVHTSAVVASGWGLTQFRGEKSKALLKVDLELYSVSECNLTYVNDINRRLENGILDESQMCAGSRFEEKDTCQVSGSRMG